MALLTDPIDLLLVDDDIVITTDIQFSSGTQAVAQGIDQRLRAFKGEWFRDLDDGVPWYEEILGEKYNEVKLRNIFRDVLVGSPGVVEVLKLTVAFNGTTRGLEGEWQVLTEFDDTVSGTI